MNLRISKNTSNFLADWTRILSHGPTVHRPVGKTGQCVLR